MRLHLAPIAQSESEQVRRRFPGHPAVAIPIGPIFLGHARRWGLRESGLDRSFAYSSPLALLLEYAKRGFPNRTYMRARRASALITTTLLKSSRIDAAVTIRGRFSRIGFVSGIQRDVCQIPGGVDSVFSISRVVQNAPGEAVDTLQTARDIRVAD
jgi:hypothetical protein